MFSFYKRKSGKQDTSLTKASADKEGVLEATKTYVLGTLKSQDLAKSYFTAAESLISRFLVPSALSLPSDNIVSPVSSPVLRRLPAPPKNYQRPSICGALTPIASCAEVLSSFRAPNENLKELKIIGLEDKVIIAKSYNDGLVYAVKCIPRCDMGSCMNYTTVLPQSIPFMVQLKMFFETENAYYLVLHRLRCGKLWNFIKTLSALCSQPAECPETSDSNSSRYQRSLSVEVINALGSQVEDFLPEFQLLIRRSFRNIPEFCVRIWAAEILLALEALHEQGLVWGDFHPGNILLHHTGHITLTYYSMFTGYDVEKPYDCVRSMYAAPELLDFYDPTPAADWWSFGAILYELLIGEPLCWNMPKGGSVQSIHFRDWLTEEAKDLVCRLLEVNPHERLGAGICGAEEIKAHPFFHPIEWDHLQEVAAHLNNVE